MDISSDSGEWAFTGSPLTFENTTKYLSGPDAWERNESNQR